MTFKQLFSAAAGLLLAGVIGCSDLSTTQKGALTGGAVGAGTGAIIGNQSGHPGAGTAIGAGVGAITGGLIGRGIDSHDDDDRDDYQYGRGRYDRTDPYYRDQDRDRFYYDHGERYDDPRY